MLKLPDLKLKELINHFEKIYFFNAWINKDFSIANVFQISLVLYCICKSEEDIRLLLLYKFCSKIPSTSWIPTCCAAWCWYQSAPADCHQTLYPDYTRTQVSSEGFHKKLKLGHARKSTSFEYSFVFFKYFKFS